MSAGARRRRVIDEMLAATTSAGVVVLAAPAGSGKTTAAAHLAEEIDATVVWYRLSAGDAELSVLLRHLLVAVAGVVDAPVPEGDETAAILQLLEQVDGRVMIVLDEVENVTGADALRALDALFADLPSSTSILLNARTFPEINLSLLSVRGRCTLLKPDLLRFRTWEIDDLFQSVYGIQLAPYELAELERRTGGWAAGLQLFHLATEHGGEDLRRFTLAAMGGRRGPSWEFLARNVVDALTPELRGFLLDVVGMRRLRVALCDELRNSTTSAELLEELASKHLFVTHATDGDGYLVHEVLGAHLRGRIVHDRGGEELDRRHADPGALLESRGYLAEAFEAYARSGRWDDARRILLQRDGSLDERVAWVFEQAPEGVMKDPWWTLASARRHRGEGRLDAAIAAYERVEVNELSDAAREAGRRERLQLVGFLRPNSPTADRWIGVVRDAMLGVPGDLGVRHESALDAAISIAALLADDPGARDRLASGDRPGVPGGLRLVCASLHLLDGWFDDRPVDVDRRRVEDLVALGTEPWLERFAMAIEGVVADDRGPIDAMAAAAHDNDDRFGEALAEVFGRLVDAKGGVPYVEAAASVVPGVERWAARRVGARADQRRQRPIGASAPKVVDPSVGIVVSCFGGFGLTVDGVEVDLSDLRPRARDVLRVLAAAGGEPVHEELIVESLWPGDAERAKPRLQTAVSGCRKVLSSHVGSAAGIERSEQSYRLIVDGADFDVGRFRELERRGRQMLLSSPETAAGLLAEALHLSADELLPECGAASWAVELRTTMDRRRVRVAAALADALRAGGDLRGAAEACERGLDSDRFDPGLWSTLLELTESSGDDAWHAFVAARHASVVSELHAD